MQLALAALVWGLAKNALAQDGEAAFELSLEELRRVKVLTATKTPTAVHAAPAVVTLVTADDIARFGYQTVAEALAHVAGFVESDDLLNHSFGVRGTSAGAQAGTRGIKILLDGQPVAFRSTQQHFLGREFIPLQMVERIEVVRGPVSVLYGADALLGAVNIITRRDGGQRLAASYERGQAGRHAAALAGSGGFESGPAWLAWGLQAAREERAGLGLPRVSPDFLRYAGRSSSPEDRADPRSAYLRGGWRSGGDDLSAGLFWQELDSDNVFSRLNPLLRPPSHVTLAQGFARMDYTRALAGGHSLRLHAAVGRGRPRPGDIVRTGASDYYLLRDVGYRALDASAEWLWQTAEHGTVLAGVDVLRDRETLESFRRRSIADGSDFQLSQPGQRQLRNTGVYGQWQVPLTQRWEAILGARRDRHSVFRNQDSFRGGVSGELPGGWGMKLMAGTAFQAPAPELLYRTAVQPGDIRGNPDLAPQKARTVELQLSVPSSVHWQAALTLYRTRVKDLVTLEQAFFNLVARNSSDSRVHGAELEARYVRDWFTGYANLSTASSRRGINRYTLAPLAQRPEGELFPRYSANVGGSVAVAGLPLHLSLDNRYVGSRPAATSNVLLANQAYALKPYWDSTLGARWTMAGGGVLRLQVRDLWDSRHVDPGEGGIDYPSLGRRYGVQYEYRF
jgi:iron complex outermembrane receptor protein